MRGRGLKLRMMKLCLRNSESPPMRGRGLKLVIGMADLLRYGGGLLCSDRPASCSGNRVSFYCGTCNIDSLIYLP